MTEAAAAAEPAPKQPWEDLPVGEYAIVELFGHTTLIGRIDEVERFGTKMLAIRPLFAGQLLSTEIYHGGAAIYRLTPCSAEVAWNRQPKQSYQVPASILAIVPVPLLEVAKKNGDDDQPF